MAKTQAQLFSRAYKNKTKAPQSTFLGGMLQGMAAPLTRVMAPLATSSLEAGGQRGDMGYFAPPEYVQEAKDNPLMYGLKGAAGLASYLPVAANPVLGGLASGALYGFGTSRPGEELGSTLEGGLVGGVTGGVLSGAGKLLRKLGKKTPIDETLGKELPQISKGKEMQYFNSGIQVLDEPNFTVKLADDINNFEKGFRLADMKAKVTPKGIDSLWNKMGNLRESVVGDMRKSNAVRVSMDDFVEQATAKVQREASGLSPLTIRSEIRNRLQPVIQGKGAGSAEILGGTSIFDANDIHAITQTPDIQADVHNWFKKWKANADIKPTLEISKAVDDTAKGIMSQNPEYRQINDVFSSLYRHNKSQAKYARSGFISATGGRSGLLQQVQPALGRQVGRVLDVAEQGIPGGLPGGIGKPLGQLGEMAQSPLLGYAAPRAAVLGATGTMAEQRPGGQLEEQAMISSGNEEQMQMARSQLGIQAMMAGYNPAEAEKVVNMILGGTE